MTPVKLIRSTALVGKRRARVKTEKARSAGEGLLPALRANELGLRFLLTVVLEL
jgi:hypothetical protein